MDLSGLPEMAVDSEDDDDEEDIEKASDPLMSRDIVRDCLEKDPIDRTDDDIEQLLEFMHQLPAFANMTMSVRRELCAVMVFAVVERAGTIVLNDGGELDSWSVSLNGSVEVMYPDGKAEILCMGNSFGVSPAMDKEYMKGVMRTKVDDCQFVCIAPQDYCCILNQVEKNMQKVEEEGESVMVKEHRELDRTGTRKDHIVIKGTSERLTMHLVEEHSVVDPTFIEDFLLTYRTFLSSPMEVGKKLLEWFNDPSLRDKVTRVVLLWVNNHFNDFEGDPAMTRFLEEFENNLEREKMGGHLRLLNIACAAKAKRRLMTLTKPSREAPLPFILLGGSETGFGIFVDSVDSSSKATEAGLKRGDQILEVNGQNFENIQLSKAMEILRNNTHLSITVKTNLFVFKELLTRLSEEKRNGAPHLPKIGDIKKASCYSIPDLAVDVEQVIGLEKVNKKSKANTVGGRNKLKKILGKTQISILPQKPYNDIGIGQSQDDSIVGLRQTKHIPDALPVSGTLSSSNPDLPQSHHRILDFSTTPDLPDQVLRVFKADQQSRYIMISKDTTAKEVVIQAIREFAVTATPDQYSLCEVSVTPEGVIKQRRLPDQLSKLADRIQLSGRYYLKNNMETEMLCSDEDAQELLRESQISLLQLSTVEVTTQLSMRNFELFRNIEPTEYIDDLFKLKSKTSCANLKKFEEVINQETFWVASEILRETNQLKRMKIIKHFIKIALHCRECKNFNSMFAIISGLNLAPVARLRTTWEKLPNKYEKLFQDLQDLFDPSRNMAKYRNVLSGQNLQPPVIPLFPIIKKDLTFLHEGNDSKVDGLVNFEKLRMIAKEIRHVGRMASVNMDPALMFRTRKKKWRCLGSLSQGSANATVLDVAQTGGHKKRVRRSSFLNAKKIYEDAQMARKVKQYLSNLELEMDEESLRTLSLQCEPATRTLPKNPGDKKPVKSETSPVVPRAGPQQKVQPQQPLPQRQPPHKTSQGLQVPAVSLYPSRKKVPVKDLPPSGINSPQALKKILSLSEEGSLERHRKQAEDTISNASSQLSSPPTSPQSSPRKGYTLAPSGTVNNFSDSGHNEISSRTSIVSNSSFDSVPVSLHDERHQRHSVSIVETNLGVGRMERQTLIEPDQYSLGSYAPVSESRGLYAAATVISSPSAEELSHDQGDRVSLDAADSSSGSWTSCSSGSHDNIQTIQHQKSWETLPFGHTHFDYSGDAAGIWASGSHMDQIMFSDHSTKYNRQNQSRESLEQAQSLASWASSTGYWGEDSEGDTGTIKRRGGKDVSIEAESSSMVPVTTEEAKPVPMPAHIAVTSSTTKGLIAWKEGRYLEPPPVPPGYVGIPIADFPEGPCHPARKPPDYNVALQRSRMVTRFTEAPAPVQTPPAGSRPGSKPQWHKPSDADPRLAPFQPQGFAGAATEEDDFTKLHLTDSLHPQVTHVSSSHSGCNITSNSGNSSLSDIYQATESEAGDMDLSGLPEMAVDSEDDDDEEDIEKASDPLMSRDIVRDCLEKDPIDRTDDDIEQLLEFMHQLPAFANMTMSVRRELCAVMVFAVVERAGTIVLNDGGELDSWSVSLNGSVEVMYPDGKAEILCMGNSFGVSPAMDKEYMKGVMRTKVDDCQFVCIAPQDYCCILNQVEKNMQKVEEEGESVMVKEHRELDRTGTRKDHIVIKGTSERLTMHLVEEHSVVDPTFIEDFLLTYRTFLSSPMEVGKKLLEWFNDPSLRDKVTRVVLLWVNNHFNDFEGDPAMTRFLEEFENNLEREKMGGHLRLLNIACAAKAKRRLMTLTKPSREAPLPFILLGGSETGFGIFVDSVDSSSKATEAGLKRGDQILEVNGQNFENIQLSKAMEILRNNTHLSITVKTNLFVFKELLTRLSEEKRNGAPHLPKIGDIKKASCYSIPDLAVDVEQVIGLEKVNKKSKANTVGGRNKLKKILGKTQISILPQKPYNDIGIGQSQDDSIVGLRQTKHIPDALPVSGTLSSSNPDLPQSHHRILDFSTTPDLPDQVLRVFKADQQSRYIMISKDTTAKEVVIQAIREFAVTATPDQYSLCEVSVTPEGVIKQRRLPDQLSKLADRIQLSGRYYLKNNMETEMLCSDEDAQELLWESQISLLQLSTVEVTTQLSMRNFELFRNIEPTEYIDDLFKLKSKTSCANLKKFEEVINQETFWVASEILRETNQLKRMKIIKHFIKIALHCRECKNFNSMFAIISGLNLAPVARLRTTWEKLPNKYEKLFQDLQDLFDPSRNMAKYRNVLSGQNLQPPVIPLFPIIKKDLTFLHEGNDSKVDGLVNFEKLRMIAKEIRHVGRMASVNMDPALMFRTRKKKWRCLGSLSQGSANATVLDVAQTGGHKKRKRRSSFLNAKKLYEDAQMARKVKQYLSNLELDMDEESLRTLSLQCEPATRTLPKNPGDKKPVKSETSPVVPRAGPQQKVQPQQPLPQRQPPHKTSQGLQVPAVSLYPSRKKVPVKDLPPSGINSPQALKKILSLSEEGSLERHRKQAEDTISNASSQLSSPPTSPQSSPRKGYTLAPSGTVNNFSDSGHNEISSRTSIVSNSSFDSVPVSLHDERHQRHSVSIVETNLGVGRMERRTLIEPDQYSLGSYAPVSESRGLYAAATVISSPSAEELSHDQGDRASLDAADSSSGSWTSCSSGSHDNIQTIQHQKSWETLPFGHTHFDYSGDAAGIWASGSHMDQIMFSDHSTKYNRQNQSRESLEQAQSLASWASSTGYWGEDSEGDTGTIKRRGGKDVSIEAESSSMVPVTTEEAKPVPMPAHIAVTSSTTKGLIAWKEGRYLEPPPVPPGYVGIPIADFPEGPCHPARKPPDYNVALQRSRMVTRFTKAPAPVQTPPAGSRPGSKPQWHKPSDADPRLAPFQPQGFAGAATEEDEDEQVSVV